MEKLPSLFTGKLVRLAASRPQDSADHARWSQDPEYMRQMDTDFARPMNEAEAAARLPGTSANSVGFAIRTLADDRLIGFVALFSIEWNNQSGVLAIGIGETDYRGKGYGTDALELALYYAFNELNLYRVGLDVIGNNARAIHAYEKVGFKREGAMRASLFRDGQRVDRVLMGILLPEWQARFKPDKEQS